MTTGHVVTVLGPIAPDRLGPTDAHEHLFLETPAQPEDTMTDLKRAVAELEEGRASGLSAVVELTPIGLGRRLDLLAEASRRTGVTIVGGTGYHRDAHYPAGDWVYEASVDQLTDRILADLRDELPAGVIKGGASLDRPTAAEERRLRAVAAAARETGAPVVVHCEAGTAAHEVVDVLCREGMAADRITLAHMDRNPDRALHMAVCGRGVNLVYDTIGRAKYGPDSARIDLLAEMVAAGCVGQIMLGLDLGRRAYHRSYGGEPGLRHLLATFVPELRRRVGDAAVEAMLVANPARFLAMPA